MERRIASISARAVIVIAALAIATPASAYETICDKNPQACGSDVKLPPRPTPPPKPAPTSEKVLESKRIPGTAAMRLERVR